MPTETREFQKEFTKALELGNDSLTLALFEVLHPADVAHHFEHWDEELKGRFVSLVEPFSFVELIPHLPVADVEFFLQRIGKEEQREILDELPDDVRVDLLQEMSEEAKERYLELLSLPEKRVTEKLLEYPENSAAGWMTTEITTIREDMSVKEAVDLLKERKEETEMLSRVYVVDQRDALLGRVRLRDIAFSPWSVKISEIMQTSLSIEALEDQEEAAQMVSKYDLQSLPVVDESGKLLGVISQDDAMQIMEEESTEDLERLSAIAGERGDESYLNTTVFSHFKRRFFWVLALAFMAIVSGYVIYSYEKTLSSYFILTIYLPMVVAAGGNTGAQSATMVIRAMSLGEFTPVSFLKVAWKEARIGLSIGLLLGMCMAAQIYFFMQGHSGVSQEVSIGHIALTVALALTAQVATSTLLGAMLPIVARSLKLDPAAVASPAITTLVDVTGLVIYFSLANMVLGI